MGKKIATAGQKLDMLVAEKVMGWKWMRFYDLNYKSPDGPLRRTLIAPNDNWLEPPKYVECDLSKSRERKLSAFYHGPQFSTDMSAAWLVAQKVDIGVVPFNNFYIAVFVLAGCHINNPEGAVEATAVTAPLAICLAALKIKGHHVE
jgi:hypothetical protein